MKIPIIFCPICNTVSDSRRTKFTSVKHQGAEVLVHDGCASKAQDTPAQPVSDVAQTASVA